jgi:hypothetical protein
MQVNLKNPIFVYYLDVKNRPPSSANVILDSVKKEIEKYENITFWIVPADFTKIECVFNGWGDNQYVIDKLKEMIDKVLKENPDDVTLSKLKQELREVLIDDIIS